MKTESNKVRCLLATAILGAFASCASGPSSQYWQAAKPVTTFSEAKSVGPGAAVTMQCKGCKTFLIRDVRHVGPLGKGHDEWYTIGSRHFCSECKGEITIVKGKTEDAMQHNCSKCGEGAVTCCVASADATKK